ncbi:ATPase involved in DNA repair/chromosome segregation [Giardia duodenalis]|uniref:ATPase involved in DNA repair/chromosome segregation n=1 Tax=Giardia intestinalis TaxID=5741 RepID=V6TNP0_GIAIN|nr:ATPase involved in DNA repair/chromosome segregation [Giardia intestinalis]
MPDCDQSTIADCPYGSHSRLQQPGRVHPLPPLLQKVIALRMCQPVHRLVWTGDSLCPSATSVLRCRRSHSQAQTRPVGEPLTLGHRGRHPHSSQGRAAGRGKADTRMVLLRPASNHCILLCSPALLHLAAPVRPMTSGTATRGNTSAPTGQ